MKSLKTKEYKISINSIISFTTIMTIGILYSLRLANGEASVFIIIASLIAGLFNVIYLNLIHYTRLSKSILVNTKWTLIETIIFLPIYFGVYVILDSISDHIAKEITKPFGANGELIDVDTKFYLGFPFDFIYTFLILTIIIIVFEKIKQKNLIQQSSR